RSALIHPLLARHVRFSRSEPPGPTVSDESTVLSEYRMDGEACSPHRNLPYPDSDDESSVRSVYYPTGETDTDEMSSIDYWDSNLGTDPGYSDLRTYFSDSSDSSAHSISPDDYNDRYRAMFRSPDETSSTASSSDSLVTAWDVITARSDSDYEPEMRTARHHPGLIDDDESTSSSWLTLLPSDEELLSECWMDAIPSPYCELVMGSVAEQQSDYTPVQLYEALGIAMEEVDVVQEKWKVAEAEDPFERARRIRKLRADDEIRSGPDVAPEAYSRECGVCYADAPRERAVLTACGHIVCAPCADTMARGGRLICPYCRAPTGYVGLVEEQEGSLAADDGASDAETNERIDNSPVSCHLPLNY
ncbi:hypothetical protein PRIPAC_88819, partial [Pristionchus pacificus]